MYVMGVGDIIYSDVCKLIISLYKDWARGSF